jgi:hypothetical protein
VQAPIVHVPPEHVAAALGKLHALPHPPQFCKSVSVLTQLPLHSVGVVPMQRETHWPLVQSGNVEEQTCVHVPQCWGCVRSVSQNSSSRPEQ